MSVNTDWNPAVEGGRRRRPLRALRRLVLVVLLGVVITTVGLAVWTALKIPREDVSGLAGSGRPMHVLLVGSDSREGLTREERVELSTGSDEGERTDTIMILTIQGDRAALLSFPRDLWVTRCDGSAGRINAAIQRGGLSCLVTTVQSVSGIGIHHVVMITFGGFRDLVDAVGGVELCLDAPIADRDAGIDLPAGCQVLDGADALGFVRVRKIDDDFGRMERQQQFLSAFADEVTEPATLLNPVRLFRLANDIGGTVSVSRGTGPVALARMAWGGRGLAGGGTPSYTVPGDPRITSGGAWVLDVRTGEAEALFAQFRSGAILAEASDGLSPEDITVTVLNAAGIEGLAGQTAQRLESLGYRIATIGNAEVVDTTVVRAPAALQDHAVRLAEDIPGGAVLDTSASVEGVTLVLGRDQGGRG